MTDWQPTQYLKFKNERTQPSIDLVKRIPLEQPRRVIDIGCGPGNSTAILKARWPNAEICGLDSSVTMIEQAWRDDSGINWLHMNAADDLSALGKFDIVFSNAALQWMPDHETLLSNLYSMLNENGVLAVQVPFVKNLPVNANIQVLINSDKWSAYYGSPPLYPKHFPYEHYYNIISTLSGQLEIWQTDYIHIMPGHKSILEWYKGSGLRPYLDMLPDDRLKDEFCSDYRLRTEETYPVQQDGKVLMPFTRIFFLVCK